LPHGVVVPLELFEETQRNVAVIEAKFSCQNRRPKKSYLLSGILEFEDGTQFKGLSGTGKSGAIHYYYENKPNKVNVRALELEKAVMETLRLYENDKRMVACANDIRAKTFSKSAFIEHQLAEIKRDLQKLAAEEAALADNLGAVVGGSEKIVQWLDKQLAGLEARRAVLAQTRRELELELASLAAATMDAKELKRSLKVLFDRLDKSDQDVKRGILRQLTEKIIIYRGNKVEIRWRIPCDTGGRGFVSEEEEGD